MTSRILPPYRRPDPDDTPIEHRLFRGLALLAGVASLAAVLPVNVAMGLPPLVIWGTAAFGLLSIGAWALARRGRHLIGPYFLTAILMMDVVWFANAGSQGPINFFLLSAAAYGAALFRGRARIGAVVLVMADGVLIHLGERLVPGWVVPYPDPSTRLLDITLAFLVTCAVMMIVVGSVLAAHERRNRRIRESEQKFAAVFDLVPDGVFIQDGRTHGLVSVNPAFEVITGWTREEVEGRTGLQLGVWADLRDRERMLEDLRRDGRVKDLEYRLRRKDGTLIWASVSMDSFVLHGRPSWLGVIRDITARRASEEALLASEEKFRTTFRVAPMLMSLSRIDDGTLFEVNDPLCTTFGFAREELLGRTSIEAGLLRPEERKRILEALKDGGSARNLEIVFQAKDGSEIPCLYFGDIMDHGGERILVSLASDIRELRRMEAERRSLEAQIHHLHRLESVGRLAGGIAHDMNNVLAAIMGTADLMRGLEGRNARRVELIQEASRRGRTLVQGLMDFARSEMPEQELVDVNDLVRKEADLLASTTLQRIRLELDLAPGLPRILGSPSALATALMNLCVNAVDAMPEQGVLTLRTAALENGDLELVVADTGHGMAPDVLQRALEPFYTTKPAGKGTGLGLSMAFGTVRAHGGRMEIRSTPGKGTEVHIRLPIVAEAPAPDAERGEGSAPVPEAMRVLLVDDDPLVRESTRHFLEDQGHRVSEAVSGQEALDLVAADPAWDLVVLDHNMPGMDGAETLRRLRAQAPGLRVIVASGYTGGQVGRDFASQERVVILPKPYSREEFRRALAGLG
ncbi:MAG TPA: PAS domain S-box protein [Holophaga sp.]|nr:PAS domain S-box protein [Holophaga sp.]